MSRKTAAIATYYKSWNYGACLQAYASLVVFENLGYEAALINYLNVDERPKTAFDFLVSGNIKEAVATAIKDIVFGCRGNALSAFDAFHEGLKRTSPVKGANDLASLHADVLVAGSDQIWNPEISGGKLDPVFMLDSVDAAKRISFASSAGSHKFTRDEQEELKHALEKYDAVSVREDYLGDQINGLMGSRPFKCLDPTLVLSSEQWALEEKKPIGVEEGDRYILAFTLRSNDRDGAEFWRELSKDLDLPVWRLTNNSYREKWVNRQLLGMTPQEFLWLIHNASFVVTDSFHGTAFSINYSTPFATLPSKTGNNTRMLDLLTCCGLENRFVADARYRDLGICGFDKADRYLAVKRLECLEWLERASRG